MPFLGVISTILSEITKNLLKFDLLQKG